MARAYEVLGKGERGWRVRCTPEFKTFLDDSGELSRRLRESNGDDEEELLAAIVELEARLAEFNKAEAA